MSATQSLPAEVRLYDRLFDDENPGANRDDGKTFIDSINPDSLTILSDARVEMSVKGSASETHYQFEREGYFTIDKDSSNEKLVFNRTVSLRDSWAKLNK